MHVVPRFDGEWFFLSNFYEAPTFYVMADEALTMKTGEHAFQAAKFHAMRDLDKGRRLDYVRAVQAAPTAAKAKYIGRSVKIDTELWDNIKDRCMREVVYEKFTQRVVLQKQLLDTGSAMLVEGNDWNDKYWGRVDGKGYNKLGVILMEVRGYCLWQSRRNSPEMGS